MRSSRETPCPYRVAILTIEFPALSETFVLDQITRLLELGHDVRVYAYKPRDDEAAHPDVDRLGLRARTVYPDMPTDRLRRITTALAIFLRADRGQRRRLLRSLNALRYGRDAVNLRLFYWVDRLRDVPEFDIIHCHFGPIGRLFGFLREIGAIRGKLVTTFHGIDVSAYLRSHPRLYNHLFVHGDLFLPISKVWADTLKAIGAPPSKTIVHRMGTDPGRFPYRPPVNAAARTFRLLSIGRLVEKKGIAFALRAVAQLIRQGYDVQYDIVGDGPLRHALETLSVDLGIADSVSFQGWRDQPQVAASMAASDALLVPSVTDSRGDQEGIPVTLMEAMATGLPTIATHHSGIPELIEDGVNGLLVPEHNVGTLAQKIALLIDNPALAAKIAEAGRARVEQDHDNAKQTARLIGLYAELVGEKPVARG